MRKTKKHLGFPQPFKKKDSITGSLTLKTGVLVEIAIGVTPSPFGLVMMARKSFASAQSLSLRSFLASLASMTCTESTLIASPFLPRWAKVY